MKAQGAKTVQERDRFYFDNAMGEMAQHFKSSSQPLFTFIQTMSAHWPYDFTFEPEVNVPGGEPGTDPEMHEYLRRLSPWPRSTTTTCVKELRRRFPRERFLIVHYGDHHPLATRSLLGFGSDRRRRRTCRLARIRSASSPTTRCRASTTPCRALPSFETLDVSYLGSVILDLAGLPLSDSHRERLRLMALCQGRYYGCSRRDEILRFHRRLIDSGVVAAR